MKIGFKVGEHWYSSLTRTMLCSAWSHGAVAVQTNGEWWLYESTARKGDQPKAGVRDYPLTDGIAAQYVWIDIGTADDEAALAAYALVKDHDYDFVSLLAFIPAIRARNAQREYCYEVVALMLGMPIDGRITPESILFYILKKAFPNG